MESKNFKNSLTLKNEEILIDTDWHKGEIDPKQFLEQLELMAESSASNHSTQIQGIYLEALIRIYLRSKHFLPFLDLKEKLRRITNEYELEEIFSIANDFQKDEFEKVLNGGKFADSFKFYYQDWMGGSFKKGDLFAIEIRRSLISIGLGPFHKFYDIEKEKIIKMFRYWENKHYDPKFQNLHIFLFYNRETAENEFPKYSDHPTSLKLNGRKRWIYFYYVFCDREKIFLSMTGRSNLSTMDILKEILENKEQLEEIKSHKIQAEKQLEEKEKEIEEIKEQTTKQIKEATKQISKNIIFEYK